MELWAWGANNYGQLGNGQPCEQVERPLIVGSSPGTLDLNSESQVIPGGGHTLLLTEKRLYAAGWNTKGQCGLGSDQDHVPQFVKVNVPTAFVKVSAGWDFTIGIDEDGVAYGCGSNAFGQLGLESSLKFVKEFRRIDMPEKVSSVACGMRHSIFKCDKNDRILVCGSGKKGQLCNLEGPLKENIYKPVIVNFDKKICQIKAGQNFTLLEFQDKSKKLFGDSKHMVFSGIEDKLSTQGVIQTEVGWTHVVSLDQDGHVQAAGRSDYGQINGVADLKDITKISIGYEHGLAINKSYDLFSWGWNEHGNCGLGHTDNVFQPTKVTLEAGRKVINCFAGSGHSFALANNRI